MSWFADNQRRRPENAVCTIHFFHLVNDSVTTNYGILPNFLPGDFKPPNSGAFLQIVGTLDFGEIAAPAPPERSADSMEWQRSNFAADFLFLICNISWLNQMSGFASTRWSLIQASRAGNKAGRKALEDLCHRYREPIIAYLRYRGLDPESAEDVTQSFFVHLIEKRLHCQADPRRGSFRAFMLTALRNHLSHLLRFDSATIRGGDQQRASLELLSELPDPSGADPEMAFERAWAQTIVQRARKRLRDEAASQGKTELFERLSQFLIESPESGDYAELGEELGLSKNAIAAAVKRLRRRHRELVEDEIADTVGDPIMLKEERSLLAASLGR